MQINQKVHLPCSSHENLRVCVPINSHRIVWPMISRCFESQVYRDYNNNATRVHKDTDMHTSSSQTTIMRNAHNRSKQESALLTSWNLQLRMLERSRVKGVCKAWTSHQSSNLHSPPLYKLSRKSSYTNEGKTQTSWSPCSYCSQ